MKNIMTFVCLLAFGLTQAQEVNPKFEAEKGLVKATYFYENGAVKEQGYFKNNKLTGTWITFDKTGKKTAIANYKNGKKVGKWFMWTKNSLKEINYKNNAVVSVNSWKEDTGVAVR